MFSSESEDEQSEPEIQIIEEEVQKTVVDEDGNEKIVTVTVQKEVIKEPSEKKKDGESRKKSKQEKNDDRTEKSEKKDKKHRSDKSKSKSEKDVDEKEGKKHSSKEKNARSSASVFGKDAYGKTEKKRITADTIGEIPEVVNLTRRLDAVENGLKGLRNIVDSMVNQVDFGDGVGDILKAQLEQVQQQMNKVELVQKEEPKDKKKKKGKKGQPEEVPQSGIITEGGVGEAVAAGQAVSTIVGQTAPGAPTGGVLPAVIPPPAQRAQDSSRKTLSRKESRKGVRGAGNNVSEVQQDEKPPLKKRTTLKDLQLRKKAREEGVSIEEIEAREATKEGKKENKKEQKKEQKDNKDNDDNEEDEKKDSDMDDSSSMESLDSEEEAAAMEEMIMEEIEAALDNAADDPEAQAYALRLSIEQMNNMKKNLTQSQDEFRKEMNKNKSAIAQIAKELSLFRAARKAQVRYYYFLNYQWLIA